MAPPEHPFPVSELEKQVHTHSVNLKERNRKLGPNFNLKDCELYELVQYSCTSMAAHRENIVNSPTGKAHMECFPFVRLFRRCGQGDKMFHVETTAWEGQHAWHAKPAASKEDERQPDYSNTFANFGGNFWSKR